MANIKCENESFLKKGHCFVKVTVFVTNWMFWSKVYMYKTILPCCTDVQIKTKDPPWRYVIIV